jgi:precorrin-2 C20-methyltransferase / precorrin-3B C17-methyltransferase
MRDILLAHREPGTLVVIGPCWSLIGRSVSGPDEDVRVVRLADLNPAEVDMRCL